MEQIKENLKNKIEEYFQSEADKGYHSNFKIHVTWNDAKCTVHLSQMYEGISKFCKFEYLNYLSKLLGTEKIDIENDYFSGGCESCDHGSCDEIDLVCYDCNLTGEDNGTQENN